MYGGDGGDTNIEKFLERSIFCLKLFTSVAWGKCTSPLIMGCEVLATASCCSV